jgi:hypothetical protein
MQGHGRSSMARKKKKTRKKSPHLELFRCFRNLRSQSWFPNIASEPIFLKARVRLCAQRMRPWSVSNKETNHLRDSTLVELSMAYNVLRDFLAITFGIPMAFFDLCFLVGSVTVSFVRVICSGSTWIGNGSSRPCDAEIFKKLSGLWMSIPLRHQF